MHECKYIALWHDPWIRQRNGDFGGFGVLIRKFRKAVYSKANPRSEEYMQALCGELIPDAKWLSVKDSDWEEQVKHADVIYLVYPDAIGLWFGAVERQVNKSRKAWADVQVLNGRRRRFRLNFSSSYRLKMRRFLEHTMLVELLFLPVFVGLTPMFLLVDLVKRRT